MRIPRRAGAGAAAAVAAAALPPSEPSGGPDTEERCLRKTETAAETLAPALPRPLGRRASASSSSLAARSAVAEPSKKSRSAAC